MTIFVTVLLNMKYVYAFALYLQKKPIILSLFKIDILNFTMYILTTLTCPLQTYVVRLHNLTLINIFFTIDHKRS